MATINLEVCFKINQESVLYGEVRTVNFLVDSFGLWSVPDELVLKKAIEKKFLGTICIGRKC